MTSANFQQKIACLYGKTDENGKTRNFVNFYPGNVVECLNGSLNLILFKSTYINNKILILEFSNPGIDRWYFKKTGSDVIWRHDVGFFSKFQETFLLLI